MSKLLYVKASPRGDKSVSIQIANEFVSSYKESHKDSTVEEVELWNAGLPEFDGDSSAAKMSFFGESPMSSKQKACYKRMMEIFEQFNSADEYIFAIPLWNFGIPYKLKQYVDILTMPGTLFDFDPEKGYIGLLKGKKATAVYTAAILMPGLSKSYGSDHATEHFTDWLNFAGVEDVTNIWFYGNKMLAGEDREKELKKAIDKVRAAAKGVSVLSKS